MKNPFNNELGFINFALYLKQLQDTGNDRRVTPTAEEISKEEFESYIKKETNLALRECREKQYESMAKS